MSISERLRPGARKVGTFASGYAWLIRDHLYEQRLRAVWILCLSGLGAIAQGSLIAFLGVAVEQLESGVSTGWSAVDSVLASPLMALLLYSGVFLLLSGLGAAASYLAAVEIRRLARSYSEGAALRGLAVLATSNSLRRPGMARDLGSVRRLVMRDTIQLSKSLEAIVRMIEPVLRAIVALGVLTWIDPRISLLLAPLALLGGPLIYRVALGTQRDSTRFFEQAIMDRARALTPLSAFLNRRDPWRGEEVQERVGELYLGDPRIRVYYDEFDKIQLAQERMQLATSLISSASLAIALLGGGYLATQGALSWGKTLAYLLGLMQCVSAARAILGNLTTLSLFYPAVRRYRAFCTEPLELEEREAPGAIGLQLDQPALLGSATELALRPGDAAAYISETELGRAELADQLAPLVAISSIDLPTWAAHTALVADSAPPELGSLRDVASVAPGTAAERELLGLIDACKLRSELDALAAGLDTSIISATWQELSRDLRFVLQMAPTLSSQRTIVLVGARLLDGVTPPVLEAVFEQLRDRIAIVVANGPPPAAAPAQVAIVARGRRVAGMGDLAWLDTVPLRASSQTGDAGPFDDPEIAG